MTPTPLPLSPERGGMDNEFSFRKNNVPPSPLSPRRKEERYMSVKEIMDGSPDDMYIHDAFEKKNSNHR